MSFLYSLSGFIVAIGILVAVHEFGHYWVARRLGVKVLRFSIGFGKPIWSRFYGKDQTEYVISMIPLGGYVKMLDEADGEVPEEELHRAFNRQVLWRRVLIVLAGPAFNFLFAILMFSVINLNGIHGLQPVVGQAPEGSIAASLGIDEGDRLLSIDNREFIYWGQHDLYLFNRVLTQQPSTLLLLKENGSEVQVELPLNEVETSRIGPGLIAGELGLVNYFPPISPEIGLVEPDSPAARAGLEVGDIIKSVNGEAISGWRDLVSIIMELPGEMVSFDVLRADTSVVLTVIPEEVESGDRTIGRVGIAPAAVTIPDSLRVEYRYSVPAAIAKGVDETWLMSILTLRMLGKMLVLEVSPRNISGPITIAQYAGETARIGIVTFMSFLAIISISLGVLNLLPIPMLDGGHLLFYVFETLIGKPVSERIMLAGQQLGMVLLFGLMCLAFYNDIFRLLG